jgi:hypothetical protein
MRERKKERNTTSSTTGSSEKKNIREVKKAFKQNS